jgi:hypothetical protein
LIITLDDIKNGAPCPYPGYGKLELNPNDFDGAGILERSIKGGRANQSIIAEPLPDRSGNVFIFKRRYASGVEKELRIIMPPGFSPAPNGINQFFPGGIVIFRGNNSREFERKMLFYGPNGILSNHSWTEYEWVVI